MDDFEKVYTTGADEHGRWRGDANYQAKLLTLLDGLYLSKKLFLLTSNSKNNMDSHLMNRPGRLYYMLEFNGLDASFVEEYCEDNLVQKEYIPAVTAISGLFEPFNFDMLKAMVEDMNRYNEGPAEVLKYLNVRPGERGNNKEQFNIKLIVNGEKNDNVQKTWRGNPLSGIIQICSKNYSDARRRGCYAGEDKKEDCTENGEEYICYFSAKNLQSLDAKNRVYRFQNEAKDVLVLTPVPSLVGGGLNIDALASSAMERERSLSMDGIGDTDVLSEAEKYKAMLDSYGDY